MNYWFSIVIPVVIAHLLLCLSFLLQPIDFWILFPLSLFVLSVYALTRERLLLELQNHILWLGFVSGFLLYGVFAFGKWFIAWSGIPLLEQLEALYQLVQPVSLWNYLFLFLIIIPGEELFWRGLVVKRLSMKFSPMLSVSVGALFYASAHIYSGTILLVVAALLAGFVWGWIYLRTRSIWVAIFSHLVFDLFLLVVWPLM
ncbi:CPBP family intramembrane glutamic endopeptidase [Bacillus sp. FJAT-45350]|uniref:CPBP family intramembrane glutamic endopeptidase n=1 Tax=Bacillus sp. FJAT-45350 TaxID=2011014 RepID=UPI000BB69D93|nr:CPBP family intramembrane glutamic endopeptidase [Bacillus sp. FJAT-45350]